MIKRLKQISHPMILSPRRLLECPNDYLIAGGNAYSEEGCGCGKTGITEAFAIAYCWSNIPVALRKLELLENSHAR